MKQLSLLSLKNELMNKEEIVNSILNRIAENIQALKNDIHVLKESRDSDTKSSVGDKYETSRAMAQIEIEKREVQLQTTLKQQNDFGRINTKVKYDKAEFGSLVVTNSGVFFLSIPLGQLTLDGQVVFCLSMASPIGKIMSGNQVGDSFNFNLKDYLIEAIY